MNAYMITLDPVGALTDEAFYQLCWANPDVKFERSPKGELIITSPTGGEAGRRNADILTDLGLWNRQSSLVTPSTLQRALSCPMVRRDRPMSPGLNAVGGKR